MTGFCTQQNKTTYLHCFALKAKIVFKIVKQLSKIILIRLIRIRLIGLLNI